MQYRVTYKGKANDWEIVIYVEKEDKTKRKTHQSIKEEADMAYAASSSIKEDLAEFDLIRVEQVPMD